MKNSLLVSVIIPLYNKEKCISDTLYSVINQTYKNIEIVVVDDGSLDKSADIVLAITDHRIKYYKQQNAGVSVARNKGIDLASGDWILFLDADDYLYEGAINELVQLHSKYPAAKVCSGNYKIIHKNGTAVKVNPFIDDEDIKNSFKLQWINNWNIRLGSFIVLKKSIQNNKFPLNVSMGEDVLFVNKLLENKIVYSNEVIMNYNKEFSNLSSKKISIQKCYAWNNKVINKNIFRTFSNGFELGKSFIILLKNGQFKNFGLLLAKKGVFSPIIIIAILTKILQNTFLNK